MLEIYSLMFIMFNIFFTLYTYFHLTSYYRILFIFMIIFKKHTNNVIYLTNQLYNYSIHADIQIMYTFLAIILQGMDMLKKGCNIVDQIYQYSYYIIENIYYLLKKNKKISLYIENIENDIKEYNIIYISKRDELLQSAFQNLLANMFKIIQENKISHNNNHHKDIHKYKNNIKGKINKLKKKKKILKKKYINKNI